MCRDNKGMTLIEVMIALILLAITSLALIQSVLLATNINIINSLRDEAVSVTEQRLNELRSLPFTAGDMLVTSPSVTEASISRHVRSVTCNFTVNKTITQVDVNTRQVTLIVTWPYKGKQYQHGVSTVVRAQ